MILFFDTETTGVPKNYNAPSSDLENWSCRLVQIAWILESNDGQILSTGNFIIKPEGFEIPQAAIDVHGITTEKALKEGENLKKVMCYFIGAARCADVIVGHNISYDMHIVGSECFRAWGKDYTEHIPTICTMKSSIEFCAIPGKYGHKFPKLQELHKKLFDNNFDDAHDAMADILATRKCYHELKERGII